MPIGLGAQFGLQPKSAFIHSAACFSTESIEFSISGDQLTDPSRNAQCAENKQGRLCLEARRVRSGRVQLNFQPSFSLFFLVFLAVCPEQLNNSLTEEGTFTFEITEGP